MNGNKRNPQCVSSSMKRNDDCVFDECTGMICPEYSVCYDGDCMCEEGYMAVSRTGQKLTYTAKRWNIYCVPFPCDDNNDNANDDTNNNNDNNNDTSNDNNTNGDTNGTGDNGNTNNNGNDNANNVQDAAGVNVSVNSATFFAPNVIVIFCVVIGALLIA